MLYAIRQIKINFIGIIKNGFVDKQSISDSVDSVDSNKDDFINKSELLKLQNKNLSNKINTIIEDLKNNLLKGELYEKKTIIETIYNRQKNETKEVENKYKDYKVNVIKTTKEDSNTILESEPTLEDPEIKPVLKNLYNVLDPSSPLDYNETSYSVVEPVIKNSYKEVKTKQVIPKLEGVFKSSLNISNFRDSINISSFSNMIRNMNFLEMGNFLKEIENISQKYNLNDEGGYNYTPFNIHELKKVFIEKGYEADRIFGGKEMGSLISLTKSLYLTQKKIDTMIPKDKIRLLLDFDSNGYLQKEKNLNVGELQMDFHIFDSLTSDGAGALIKNLGLGNLESFSKKMKNNLLSSKDIFQRELYLKIKMGIKLSQLVQKDGVKEAVSEIYKNKELIVKEIGNRVDNHIETNLQNFKGIDKKAVKLEAIGLLLGNSTLGAGASFDINKLNLFFDSLQAGFIFNKGNVIPGVAISKEILNKNGFNVTGSLINIFIPSLSGSYTSAAEIDDFKKLFPNEIKGKISTSVYASVSTLGKGFGVSFNNINEKSSNRIEQMTDKMSSILKQVGLDIKNGKHFSESAFGKISENKTKDAETYNKMLLGYNVYAKGKEYSDIFLKDMMQGYLSYYETKLYNNGEGNKITSLGAGIFLLSGFLPIPYLTIGGENIEVNWKNIIHSINEERGLSHKSIDINKSGIKEVIYKGMKVLSFPNGNEYEISNSNGSTQAELVDNIYYISGDISNIIIDEHTKYNQVLKTIVIGGGKKDSKGLYLKTSTVSINNSIEGGSTSELDISVSNLEAINSTESIRNNLFNIIQTDALNHPKTIGMQKLQKMIFDYKKNGNPELNTVWNQFKKVINYPGFKKYAEEKGVSNQVTKLINSVNTVSNNNEKVIIIQNISSNLMKKIVLKDDNGEISIKGNKTILEHDRKRNNFFDTQFSKEFPSLLPEIKLAREEWYKVNGNAKKYNFKTISDGSIAFTGVESKNSKGKINIQGVMPFTGVYNIASIEGGKDFIYIDGKSPEVINKLPNHILEGIKVALNSNGTKLTNIEDVKTFINSGGNDLIKIDYNLAFCMMGECLNDTVVLQNLVITKNGKELKIGATTTSEVYNATHNIKKWGIAFTGEANKVKSEKESNGDDVTTTPGGDGSVNNSIGGEVQNGGNTTFIGNGNNASNPPVGGPNNL